jgi:DNA-binding NarL/FixJ family response regulator
VIGVLLVDDQPLVRLGFRAVLDGQPDMTVLGEAGDGAEALAMARRLRPDVVLMDVRMPRMDGIEATRRIVGAAAGARVLILTTFDLDEYVFAALRAGASGFLTKDALPADLTNGVRVVAAGDAVVAPAATRRLVERFAEHLPDGRHETDPRLDGLTGREREVLVELARGRANREIAERLHVSEGTVKVHVGHLLAKLDLRDRAQLIVFAYENGVVRPGRR